MIYEQQLKKIKEQVAEQIVGNYLKGAGENVAYLDDVKVSKLGKAFLSFGESIDLINDVLVDYNKVNPKMQSAGTLSIMIKETFEKLDKYAMKCEARNYSESIVKKDLTKYANSLLDGVNLVAYSEGDADTDLKADIKILLREGRETFEKRIEEEEKEIAETQANNVADPNAIDGAELPEEGEEGTDATNDGDMEANDDVEDDSDFQDGVEEGEEPADDNEEGDSEDTEDTEESEDYDKLAEEAYGADDEEGEGDDTEDDEIPSGESFYGTKNKAFGENGIKDGFRKAKEEIIKLIEKAKYEIVNRKELKEERAVKRTAETARKDKIRREKRLSSFMKSVDKYIADMDKYLLSEDEATCTETYKTMTKFLADVKNEKSLKVGYPDIHTEIVNAISDREDSVQKKYIKHMKDKFDVKIKAPNSGTGESFMFRRNSGYTTIDPTSFAEMKEILLDTEENTMKSFSESMGMAYIAESTDYAAASKSVVNVTAVVLAARYKFGKF